MPSHNLLLQLHRFDRSSFEFHDQLCNILYGEAYQQCLSDLQSGDFVWLVDYLDETLGSLDPASPAFRKCLRELRHICGSRLILPTSYTLPFSLLTIGRQPVASGGCGDIYEGNLNGSRVCVKRVRVYSKEGPEKATKTFYQEAVVWKHLTHPNIVPFFGITPVPFQLILEWMPGGDLLEYIKDHPSADRLHLLLDVAEGLHFLHSRNVVHGDLKGPNILMDVAGRARITDFGLANVVQNLDSMRSATDDKGHTARWTAPEILNEQGTYSKEADVFSFAMVMIEAFTGAVPFHTLSPAGSVLSIMNGRRPPRPTHPNFTDQLWTLIQRCWEQDPHMRPQVSEALGVLLTPDLPAWKQLTSSTLETHKRIPLVRTVFSDSEEVEIVGHLCGDDAQTFVDVIDEVLDSLPPRIQRRCLRSLYRICGRQALVPRSLEIPLCYDPGEHPLCHGGFADVWRGQYHGRDVAAKVLRVYSKGGFEKPKRRFCREVATWNALRHPNVLPLLGVTMSETRFVMVSEWMVKGNINEFVKADTNVDQLALLREVTRGLIYMHDVGVVHGDLKGANILINNDGHACLADFSLLTIATDQSTIISSCIEGGTIQWMSPELIDPESFGLEKTRPTKESDCYALGMVIHEVLSGQTPFTPWKSPLVIRKVLNGERPGRPQGTAGALFTDTIWDMLELCWKHNPVERTNAKAVLPCLEGVPLFRPTSPTEDGDAETDTDDRFDAASSVSSLPIAQGDNKVAVPPSDHPRSATSVTATPDGGRPSAAPRTRNPVGVWVGRLADSARDTLKGFAGKFHGS